MNILDLKPARDFAQYFGVKSLIYGPPGGGKTPIINTCPRPVMLACEAGLLSMRNSMVPTWRAFTGDSIDEFFKWLFSSNEAKNFDTVAIDSSTEMAQIYLQELENGKSKLGNKVHGLAAYGMMAKKVLEHLNMLYFTEGKHAYVIAKQQILIENNLLIKKPYFPGIILNSEMPHKYDQILQLDIHNVPGIGPTRAFRCVGTIDVMARDRTGQLAEFEFPDFGQLVKKAMS